jgi:hypothetical protein
MRIEFQTFRAPGESRGTRKLSPVADMFQILRTVTDMWATRTLLFATLPRMVHRSIRITESRLLFRSTGKRHSTS